MSSSNPNEANNFLQNTIKLKTRTLKPYEKKFVRKGEFRYDVPIQSSIPSGQPTVCYARNAEVPINQQADTPLQQISHSAQLDTCSQPSEDMPRTALSGQNVAHNFETVENEAMSTEETEIASVDTEMCCPKGKYEALDILTPRPTEKKDVVFIWNLDIFKTLMTASCLDNKEKDILTEQVNELAVDLAETHFYFKDLQDYDMINVYDNPLTDTGQYIGQTLDDSDNMAVEDKQKYNKLTSLCRQVRDSYCDKCRQNINDLVSLQKETQWSTVRQKMDELKDKWLNDALKSLQIINSRSSCVNILFTTNHLVQALSHVLLFELADIFKIENIYSTANIGKEKCFQRIAQQFGTNCNTFVFGVSTQDEKVAEKMKMAFWKVADQSDVDSLHHALELNYL